MPDDWPDGAKLCREWLRLDEPYAANGKYGLGKPNSVRHVVRPAALLLVAAHAVHHDRAGRDRASDARTGGLVELVGMLLRASSVAATGYVTSPLEWERRSDDLKRVLDGAIQTGTPILDIHGMGDSYSADICIGTGPSATQPIVALVARLATELAPLTVAINRPFAARQPHTITAYAQSRGGMALQIELAARLRQPPADPARAEGAVHALVRAGQAILRSNEAT